MRLIISIILMMCSVSNCINRSSLQPESTSTLYYPTVSTTPPTVLLTETTKLANNGEKIIIGSSTFEPISSLSDLKKAVIEIEAQGTFSEPVEIALPYKPGYGSGFIVDPRGIAVTTHHVVSGAENLKVRIGDSQEEIFNAKILGVSECSDLALIQIEGDTFPYLEYLTDGIVPGTNIFLAGYKLETSGFSLVKGVIFDVEEIRMPYWNIDGSQIFYEILPNGGMVGGPIVNVKGDVLGLHQANVSSANRYSGTGANILQSFMNEVLLGKKENEFGINSEIISVPVQGTLGLWVSAVAKGSVADKTGVSAGDIITDIGKNDLPKEDIWNNYCELLHSDSYENPIPVRIIRPEQNQILEGELSGRKLQMTSQWLSDTPEPHKSQVFRALR